MVGPESAGGRRSRSPPWFGRGIRDGTGRARRGRGRRRAGDPGVLHGHQRRPGRSPVGPIRPARASGVWATPAGDGKGDVPAKLGTADLYDRIAHNLYSINYVWVLIAGFLVMFMQAGFMLVETGLFRAKNAAHTAAMNFMVYPLGCLAFWAYGFAIGWGNWWNGPVPPGWYPSLGPGLVGAQQRHRASAPRPTPPATPPACSRTA